MMKNRSWVTLVPRLSLPVRDGCTGLSGRSIANERKLARRRELELGRRSWLVAQWCAFASDSLFGGYIPGYTRMCCRQRTYERSFRKYRMQRVYEASADSSDGVAGWDARAHNG